MNKNIALIENSQPTMSSMAFLDSIINPARISAGESEVENRHFIARIEDEIDDLEVAENFYVTTSQGAKRKVKGYMLNIEQMTLIGMRESKAVRRAVLIKLKALSNPIIDPLAALDNPEFLRGTLLTYTEKVIALEHKVEEMRPKAEFHDKVSKAPDAITLAEAAKTLGTGRNRLCAFLRQNGWLRRNNEPYQDKINQGLLDVKLSNWEHPDMGIQQAVTALVTGKGLAKLSQILSMEAAV